MTVTIYFFGAFIMATIHFDLYIGRCKKIGQNLYKANVYLSILKQRQILQIWVLISMGDAQVHKYGLLKVKFWWVSFCITQVLAITNGSTTKTNYLTETFRMHVQNCKAKLSLQMIYCTFQIRESTWIECICPLLEVQRQWTWSLKFVI